MKKLMIIAAMTACGSVFATGSVSSANIVGYMTVEQGQVGQYTAGGSMFVTPGGTTYKLSDLSISGYTPATKPIAKAQYIQFFLPSSLRLDSSRAYYNYGGKWYNKFTTATTTADAEAADFEIPAGTGFMCNFGKAGSKIMYAGEILTSAEGLSVGCPSGAQYFFISNPYPVPVNLDDISISGYTPATKPIAKAQYIQFFQKSSLKLDQARAFYNFGGKWYYKYTSGDVTADAVATGITLQPGEGFVVNFGKNTSVLKFPAFTLE